MPIPHSSLRLIVIAGTSPGNPLPLKAITAALRGGATLIQLRGKILIDREILAAAMEFLPVCREAGVPFILNDRPDLALAAGVDGAHVGPDDLPPATARRVLGREMGLGVSARTRDRIHQAEEAHADYLGTGALRSTSSKPGAEVLGFDGIADLVEMTQLPVVAIGGVRPGDVPRLKQLGVAGIAVMSGVLDASDPEAAARAYLDAWDSAGA